LVKVIGISGSPRAGGNTELLLSEALKAVEEEGGEAELIGLAGREVKPCDACLSCGRAKACHIDDDLRPIFEKMRGSDGIILASPVYFSSATPQIKALIDRAGYLSNALGRVFENKVGGAMVVGRRAGHNFALAQLLFFFLHQGMIIPGSTYWNVAFGRDRGEVLKDSEGVRTARNFGRKLHWLCAALEGAPKPRPE
jgi:multimeric flavodoxin WrbA